MITIPTIQEIKDQIISDIELKIGQTIPTLPKAFFRVLATALAGVLSLVYRYGRWIYEQIFPQTAEIQALRRIGEQYGIFQTASVAAVLTATATGITDSIIPSGTLWQANGIVYQQAEGVIIANGIASITVEALTTGENTNLIIGTKISLVSPVAGVNTDAIINTTLTSGQNEESILDYRNKILQRLQQRPQGGATPDYILWALEVPGVKKAFAFTAFQGEVTVFPLVALSGVRVPTESKRLEIQNYLNAPIRKPLGIAIAVGIMIERIITLTVSSLQPNTTDVRAAVLAAWDAYLLRAFPVQYPDQINQTHIISLSGLYAEASIAGAQSITMTMNINGVPGVIQAYTLQFFEIVKLGTVTWPV